MNCRRRKASVARPSVHLNKTPADRGLHNDIQKGDGVAPLSKDLVVRSPGWDGPSRVVGGGK